MRSFADIYATACLHKGSEQAVEENLPRAKSTKALMAISDAHYLSNMSRRIFRAGLKHEMVDAKWPAFEDVFQGFDPFYCAMMNDEQIEQLMSDRRIIRHLGKVKSVRANGAFIRHICEQHQSFGEFIALWPDDDVVGLWLYLKKHATQMGGMSGAAFLRMVGKDTFLLTRDVVAVLITESVITKTPTSKKDLLATQDAFNVWREETGRSYCELSRIVSFTATV